MLGPNQEKVIIDAVNKSENLMPELGSALLAAFQSERALRAANVQQLEQYGAELIKLNWERDETLRTQREVEAEIDLRVNLRTDSLNEELEDSRITRDEAVDHAEFCKKECDLLEEKLGTAYELISRLRDAVETGVGQTWLRGIWTRRVNRSLLRDVEKQIPDLDQRVSDWREDRAEAQD